MYSCNRGTYSVRDLNQIVVVRAQQKAETRPDNENEGRWEIRR